MPSFDLKPSSGWQKIASAGSAVVVQNTNEAPALIMTSAGGPPPAGAGLTFFGPRHGTMKLTLTKDLYACALGSLPVTVTVMGGISA